MKLIKKLRPLIRKLISPKTFENQQLAQNQTQANMHPLERDDCINVITLVKLGWSLPFLYF